MNPFTQTYVPGREEPEEPLQPNKAFNVVLMIAALVIIGMFAYGVYLSVETDGPRMPKIADADKNKSSNT